MCLSEADLQQCPPNVTWMHCVTVTVCVVRCLLEALAAQYMIIVFMPKENDFRKYIQVRCSPRDLCQR